MADSSQSPAHTALNSRAPSLGEKEKQEGLETRTLTAVNSRQTSDTVPKEGESAAAAPPATAPVHGGPIVDESKLLTGRKLFLVFVGFLLSVLLIALDQTIVATALPQIASDFEALDQLTWIVSAYFLTQAGLMLTYGQFLTVARVKWLYLVAIFIFELGSLICGVAPNIEVLIFGRAIQGVGASGIFISVLTVIAQITKLESRPALFGSFGGVFALASVVGPLLGGVFTDEVTWRWCFYINLPLGAVSILAVVIWLPAYDPPENPAHVGMTTVQKWLSLDWLGSFLSLGMITPLLLALQWGGQTRPWNDRAVIACLVVFAVMLFIFIGWEYYMGSRAMMPLKMWKRRTQVGAAGATFFLMLMFITATYYLPFFYQAKGRTATQSGLDIIPFMLSAVVGTAGAGAVINFTGRYLPWLVTGPGIAAIGAGLLYTIDYYTPNPNLIGYQILFGFGAGIAFQNGIVAIQAEYADEPDLVPQATSLVTFLQLVGGVVGIAIAGTVFGNRLTTNLNSLPPNTLTPAEFAQVKLSVHAIFQLSDAVRQQVVDAYINAVDYTFLVDIPAGGLALMFACLVRNWNLKERGAGGVGGGMA